MPRKPRKNLLDSVMAKSPSGEKASPDSVAMKNLEENAAEARLVALENDDALTSVAEETAKLSTLNSELVDSIAGYLEQIDNLKAENKNLQTQYDQALQQIADLTFEIASLKAQLQSAASSNSQTKDPLEVKSTNVSYPKCPSYRMNGYEENNWN